MAIEWCGQLTFALSSGLAHLLPLDQGQHYCAAQMRCRATLLNAAAVKGGASPPRVMTLGPGGGGKKGKASHPCHFTANDSASSAMLSLLGLPHLHPYHHDQLHCAACVRHMAHSL